MYWRGAKAVVPYLPSVSLFALAPEIRQFLEWFCGGEMLRFRYYEGKGG